MCEVFHKQMAEALPLTEPDRAVLRELQVRVLQRFAVAQNLLINRGGTGINEFLDGKEELNKWCRREEKEHYERLLGAGAKVIGASGYFLDLLDSYRHFNSHITTIGYAFRSQATRRPKHHATETSPAEVAKD